MHMKIIVVVYVFCLLQKVVIGNAWGSYDPGKKQLSGNPYTYLACTSNADCNDTISGTCHQDNPSDPNTWFCDCQCDGQAPCNIDKDCCNNVCINRVCSSAAGNQGTLCGCSGDGCASGLMCQITVTLYGYCTTPTTGSVPSTLLPTTTATSFDCTGKADGNYSDPNHPCSHVYYTCVDGLTYQQTCPSNLYFDSENDDCQSKAQVPACQ